MPERLPKLPVYDSRKERRFTKRHIQVMQSLINGNTREQVLQELVISKRTLEYYIHMLRGGEPDGAGLNYSIRTATRIGLLNTDSLPERYDTQVIRQSRDLVVRILKGEDSREIRELEDELFKSSGIANRFQLVAMAEVERLKAGNV